MAYFNDMNIEPIVDRTDAEYTIYVNNLPIELNKDAIRDIFSQYGKILGMFHPCNANWAYITYESFREAELAIRELNDKRPLYLKIALAKNRSSMKEEVPEKSNISEISEKPKIVNVEESPSVQNDIKYQGMGRGQLLNSTRKPAIPHRYADGESSSLPSSSQIFQEIEDPFAKTNRLWTRGVINVTPDGKRHVSLGRGYTLYEFPEPDPKIEEYITTVHEQRKNGLYECSKDKFKNEVYKCIVCSIKTNKFCEKCYTHYCSKACQVKDWSRHQAECNRIPALVEEIDTNMSLLQINQGMNQMKRTSYMNDEIIKSNDVKLRRPNTFNGIQAENSNNTNRNDSMHRSNAEGSSVNGIEDKYLSAQRDNNVSQTKMTDLSTNVDKELSQYRLHRYDTNENTDQSRKSDTYSATSSSNQNYDRQDDLNKTSMKKRLDYDVNVRKKTCNDDKSQSYQRNGFQSDNSSFNNNKGKINRQKVSNDISVNDDLDFYKDTHLSKTKFITVEIIITLNSDEYWIYKLEDREARKDLMIELQNVAVRSRNVQPIIGEIYGVLYEGLWHRAMVISLRPTKVHFIDFGNDEILDEAAEIKDIGNLIKAPKFARKIRLANGTSYKYRNLKEDEQISVRMLSIDAEKTITVEVQEQSTTVSSRAVESTSKDVAKKIVPQEKENSQVSSNKSTNIAIPIPNILDACADLLIQERIFELPIEGYIEIHELIQKDVYGATFCPIVYNAMIETILSEMQDECKKEQLRSANYKPKIEELVCGKFKDGWYRGYVLACPLTSSNLRIIAVDEGRVLSVDKIVACPEKFLDICAFGIMCEINDFTLSQGEIYEFKAIFKKQSQESLQINIIINSQVKNAMVKPCKYFTNLPIRLSSELKNGSKICLTSYRNHYHMFARSLDEVEVEYYNDIMQRVALCARTAPHLSKPPNNFDQVIAPYEDENRYRAMVLEVNSDKVKIIYTDFGNIGEINVKDLQLMPQDLILQRYCSTKIFLKDVPRDVPSNQEVDAYLRNLTGNEIPLTCTYEGASPKDGVCLTMPTGECVNNKLKELLIPRWKKEEDHTCYMFDNIEFASLGRVGDTVKAVVLDSSTDPTMYMLGPADTDLITHIFEVMPALLKEYCDKTEYYIPRMQELCLALYEEAWYRAVCLNPTESDTTSKIFFLDWGNTELVEHKNIRIMPKDFITPEALANMCTIVNLAPVDNGNYSADVQKKITELVVPSKSITIKIVEHEKNTYKIELPDVRAELIKCGLV
ncbi:uncharacterized protein LOC105432843 isoform X2 [Pogonomyrmex barbatus]|nr:uncharacterized protein LOC105432843 isoform X2 [Pogonomyrmex barbatus]XP_011646110.1 uncharacterized protein LOC105432843 isoform X2 [Pogonomyrmex barbatus]